MRILLFCAAAGLLLFGFQNCSEVSFETSPQSLRAQQIEFQSSASIEIDDNAPYTKQSLVKLKLFSVRAIEMKISNQEDCSDGSWEPYTTAKVWTLAKSNAEVKVYAQFKDLRGEVSLCAADDIIHDDIPPEATFTSTAGLVTNNPLMNVAWQSKDNLSGVDATTCRGPDNLAVPCTNVFAVNSASDGAKSVTVRLTDKAGNESADFKYDWLFDQTPPTVNINSRPAALTGAGAAFFSFSGNDALSGIAKYSCRLNSGAYQDCTSPLSYAGLLEGNHKFEVIAVDKAGNSSAPQSANWVIDMTEPSLSFTKTPPLITNSRLGDFAFVGVDNNIAISKFDCSLDGAAFASCTSPRSFPNLAEGSHTFQVRGYDEVNNVSAPISFQWVIDVTPPVVTITSGPNGLGNQPSANFQWTAVDVGSGVKSVECRIDGAAYMPCAATGAVFNNLASGAHTLDVRATDMAGNSAVASRTWTIDLIVPTVTILTGPPAYTRFTDAEFTFVGQDANGIAGYECRVDAGAYAACSSPHVARSLAEGGHIFFVRARDNAGNMSQPASHSWTIDLSPPLIRVTSAPTAIKEGDSAMISFEVVDPSSGVDRVRCGLNGAIADCQPVQSVNLGTALASGDHVFTIEAKDKAGNEITERVSFQVTARPVICDPFVVGGDQTCNGGLVGDIFYLDETRQAEFKALSAKTVDYFYAKGIMVNAILALKQLFVSTRSFTQGFPSSGGGLILDDKGNTLYEYFAFRLETVLKLDATVDQPGWYQFATLSDDGSMVLMKSPGTTSYGSVLVANDGDHSTRMGCSSAAVFIDDTTRLPLMVKYYQGPRTEIALTLMWRRVPAMNSPLDSSCGKAGNDTFFGPAPYTNFTTSLFAALTSAEGGWRVIAPSNLVAPPR